MKCCFENIQRSLENLHLTDDKNWQISYEAKATDGVVHPFIMVYANGHPYFYFNDEINGISKCLYSHREQRVAYSVCRVSNNTFRVVSFGKIMEEKVFNSAEELINIVFGYVKGLDEKERIVADCIYKITAGIVFSEDIAYDPYTKQFYIKSWSDFQCGKEWNIMRSYFKGMTTSHDQYGDFAKYMSLSTLVEILKTGNLRTFSPSAMNDREEIKPNLDSTQNPGSVMEYSSFHKANHRFITSFTSLVDDLTMWRLYGDDAKGVCVLFRPNFENMKEQYYLYSTEYEGENSSFARDMKSIDKELSKHEIKFSFLSYNYIWQYFMKPKAFSIEKETRLLIAGPETDWTIVSNGVITTYFDLAINVDDSPLSITQIILGPNIKECNTNMHQLQLLAAEKRFYIPFGIKKSSHNCYL